MHVPRRILLLKENAAVGGVHTVSETLARALQEQGHHCDSLVLRPMPWHSLWRAAGQADVIIATHNFLPTYVAWLLAALRRKPVIAWFHGPVHDVLNSANAHPAKRRWLRWLYRRLPWLVFVSQHGRDSYLQLMEGHTHRQQQLRVVSNPHPTWNKPLQNAPLPAPPPWRCGYVGRLSPEKRPELLLDTLSELPPAYHLQITGEGPLKAQLQRMGEPLLARGRLQWQGFQPAAPALYRAHHLTLLASHYEGCPMSVLESLAAGVPCAGLPIPALQEMLGAHMPYALADECSSSALARAVLRISAQTPETLRHDMAQVLEHYSPQRFSAAWGQLIHEVAP